MSWSTTPPYLVARPAAGPRGTPLPTRRATGLGSTTRFRAAAVSATTAYATLHASGAGVSMPEVTRHLHRPLPGSRAQLHGLPNRPLPKPVHLRAELSNEPTVGSVPRLSSARVGSGIAIGMAPNPRVLAFDRCGSSEGRQLRLGGTYGWQRSVIPASAGVLSALRLLQRRHAATQLSHDHSPRMTRGHGPAVRPCTASSMAATSRATMRMACLKGARTRRT